MSKCKICGARLEEGIAVCPSCGTKVGNNSAEATVTASADVQKSTCPSCGTVVVGEHRFCPQCGVNLKEAAEEKKAASQPKERRCPSCGSVIAQNARFCPDCGVTLTNGTGTTIQTAKKPTPSTATPPKKSTSTAAASATSAPVTHATSANTRNLRISLIPEALSDTTEYFDTVQDACTSSVMLDKGGTWTIAVEGDLTEGELDSIVALVARTDSVKCLNLSSCVNAQRLKSDSFFRNLFGRCKGLETVRLADGSTRTSLEKKNKNQTFSLNLLLNKRINRGKIIKIAIAVAAVTLVIRFFIGYTVHDILGNSHINDLEGSDDPTSIRCFLSISPLEATAVNYYEVSEKPILASVLVHFTSQTDKNNALCYAAHFGSIEVMQVLLDNGANPNCRMRSKGTYGIDRYTPLRIAKSRHKDAAIKLLIRAGAVE